MTRQVSLITGSTRGIGKQIGIDLLKKGHFVIFTGNNISTIDKLEKELYGMCNNFLVYKVDFSNKYSIEDFIEYINDKVEKIDNVILNVGHTCRKNFDEITLEEWDNVFNVNLNLPFYLLQQISKLITRRIIFIGSVLGHVPESMSIPYGVSKGAIEILSKYLAKHFADRKITVNTIAPGFVNTDWHIGKNIEQIKNIEEQTLLKRFARSEEISHACDFIIENDYINGQVLSIDGGFNL